MEYDQSLLAKAMGGFRRRFSRMSKMERDQARTKIRHASWSTAETDGRWVPSKTVPLPTRDELLDEARRRYDLVFALLRDPEQRSGLGLEEVLGLALAQSMLCDRAFTNAEPLAFQVSHRAGHTCRTKGCLGVCSPAVLSRQSGARLYGVRQWSLPRLSTALRWARHGGSRGAQVPSARVWP